MNILVSKNPEKIGINTSSYESLADGLSKYHYRSTYIMFYLQKLKKRVVSAEDLAIAWIETRTRIRDDCVFSISRNKQCYY